MQMKTNILKICRAAVVILFCLPSLSMAQNWTVNLQDADIQELIKFVAEATNTTIVVDPRVIWLFGTLYQHCIGEMPFLHPVGAV